MACGRYLDAATRIVEIRLCLLKWRAGGATEGKSAVAKEMLRRGLDHIRVYHCAAASALMDTWVKKPWPSLNLRRYLVSSY
jgi:hypothetical protein